MTKSKRRESLRESLSSAVRPPEKNPQQLDHILGRYATAQPMLGQTPAGPAPPASDSTQLDSRQLDSTQLTPVAPARDFNKRANSIERDALPAGLFPGTSKKLYDALYLRTRGAILPVRTVKARRSELMRWANIGGLNTFLSHMKHLTAVGLVVRTFEVGDKDGAIYEVRLPEELDSTRLRSTQLDSTRPDSTPNQVHDSTQKVSRVESGQVIEDRGSSGDDKTSFKTNTERADDEAFAGMVAILKQTTKKVTGREPTLTERDRWKEVAELLATELEVAASRTTVTSAPAFLAEHLRRRLRKADARQIEKEVGEASTKQAAGASKPELTAEQIQEQVNLMMGLMRDGAEMRELEEQFAGNFRPAQWHMIRSIALAQMNVPSAKPDETEK